MLICINILDIVLDSTENDFFSIGDEVGRNVIIFGVDMSSFSHIDNKKKHILIPGKGHTQGWEHILAEEKLYSTLLNKIKNLFELAL